MERSISQEIIQSFRQALNEHPVYKAVSSLERLRIFMQHHIYSVWDFMSLVKYLQSQVAPAVQPWVPVGDGNVRRFINELVLEEESDEGGPAINGVISYASHFELYRNAMAEIGADNQQILRFLSLVQAEGIHKALENQEVPGPSRRFTKTTFGFIGSGKPHVIAAALALGREHIIPAMFRSILGSMGVTAQDAPIFHYYLERHIHLDEDFHAPLSLRLLNELCGGDSNKIDEAVNAAHEAVQARLLFWDGVLEALG